MSRFARQLPIFGEEGQSRIMKCKVGVAGCGGLGVHAITALVQAGVCSFVLADHDVPDITNLNRQFIYYAGDMRPKSVIAAEWILALNPAADVEAVCEPIAGTNADMFAGCDAILDCLDNLESRFALNDFSLKSGIPLIHAGIEGFDGQLYVSIPGRTPCLRCVLGMAKDSEGPVPSVGASVAVLANLQAQEALKVISGIGSACEGVFTTVDLRDLSVQKARISGNCPDCQ